MKKREMDYALPRYIYYGFKQKKPCVSGTWQEIQIFDEFLKYLFCFYYNLLEVCRYKKLMQRRRATIKNIVAASPLKMSAAVPDETLRFSTFGITA